MGAKQTESQLQQAIVEYLSLRCRIDGFLFFAVPNEGSSLGSKGRTPKDRARIASHLKRMGMVPGVSDLIIAQGGRIIAMEVKSAAGRQTINQKRFEEWCRACGVSYVLVRSVSECAQALKMFGLVVDTIVQD